MLTEFFRGMWGGSVCAVIGLPRQGKSRAVQAADLSGCFPRRLVFDPYAQRDRIERERGALMSPWPGDLFYPRELAADPAALLHPRARLVVQPVSGVAQPERLGAEFSAVASMLWAAGGVDLICEEAGLYSRFTEGWMAQLASGGGHCSTRLVLILQSISWLSIYARRQLSHVVCFGQGEGADLKMLKERCGESFASAAATWQRGQAALIWRLGGA